MESVNKSRVWSRLYCHNVHKSVNIALRRVLHNHGNIATDINILLTDGNSNGTMIYSYRMISRVCYSAQYHCIDRNAHSRPLNMHSNDDKYSTNQGFEPSTSGKLYTHSRVDRLFDIFILDVKEMKWNESGFRPPLCTYRLNWARRTSWGWWDDWDDTVLQTQDLKFEPLRSEAEHATSRSRRLPTILTFTRGLGRNIFVSFKPPRLGTEPRTLAWKAAVLTTGP